MIQEITGQVKWLSLLTVDAQLCWLIFFGLFLISSGDGAIWWLCSIHQRHVHWHWNMCRTLELKKVKASETGRMLIGCGVFFSLCDVSILPHIQAHIFKWARTVWRSSPILQRATMSSAKLTSESTWSSQQPPRSIFNRSRKKYLFH